MKIKISAVLNKIYSQLDRSEYFDFSGFQDLIDKADCFCTEQSNDYRDCDFAEYVEKGIEMVTKAQKKEETIWKIFDEEEEGEGEGEGEGIVYIVGTLEKAKKILQKSLEVDKVNKKRKTDEE